MIVHLYNPKTGLVSATEIPDDVMQAASTLYVWGQGLPQNQSVWAIMGIGPVEPWAADARTKLMKAIAAQVRNVEVPPMVDPNPPVRLCFGTLNWRVEHDVWNLRDVHHTKCTKCGVEDGPKTEGGRCGVTETR